MFRLGEEITKSFRRITRRGDSRDQRLTVIAPVTRPPDRDGTQFGPYQIGRRLGSGGMGHVYLAVDTRLGRKVALKFLPPELVADPVMLSRLQLEARAASSLNHPNILTIYEIGQINGEHFIASEFVEGETLTRLMHRGEIDGATAIEITRQILSALAAAHAAHIVHRDLKPGNVMVRPDSLVKVIDFGLAKRLKSRADAPVRSSSWTRPGSVIGTIDYMSPEQARGDDVDHRTDIWSAGVLLYEMLARRRPFEGKTDSHVVVAILDSPAPPLPEGGDAPAGVDHILARALAKNADERYQSAHEMLLDLQRLAPASHYGAGLALPPVRARRTRELRARVTAAVLAALVLVGVACWWLFSGRYTLFEPNWFRIERTEQVTFDGSVKRAAISPDGKLLAYISGAPGSEALHVRDVASRAERKTIPVAAESIGLSFSPDGKLLYYVLKGGDYPNGVLFRVACDPSATAPSTMVLQNVAGPIAFSPREGEIAFVRSSGPDNSIWIARDGNLRNPMLLKMLAATQIGDEKSCPLVWALGGSRIAAVIFPERLSSSTQATVALFTMDGRIAKQFSAPDIRYLASPLSLDGGSLLLFSGLPQGAQQRHLIQLSIPQAKFHEVVSSLLGFGDLSGTANSRTLSSVMLDQRSAIWTADAGRLNTSRVLLPPSEDVRSFAWSGPDIIFPSVRSGDVNLWFLRSSGATQPAASAEHCVETGPAALAGAVAVYSSNCAGPGDDFNLWRVDLRSGARAQLTSGANYDYQPDISRDGKWVVYTSWPSNIQSIWKVPLPGGTPAPVSRDLQAKYPFFSPDGTEILCQVADQAGAWHAAVLSFADGRLLQTFAQIPTGTPARWSPDGSAIDYVGTQDGESILLRQPKDGSVPRELAKLGDADVSYFSWNEKGTTLAYVRNRSESDVVLFHRASR